MNKLTVLVGPSNSGKSTWGNEVVEQSNNTIMIGRDKFREMITGLDEQHIEAFYSWPDRDRYEDLITELCTAAIEVALANDFEVIVDNTHLTIGAVREALFALLQHDYEEGNFQIVVFNTSIDEAMERNRYRNRKVPNEVITKQYALFEQLKRDLQESELSQYITYLEV